MDKKIILLLVSILLGSGMVGASTTLTYLVRNAYTFEPIESAYITLYNVSNESISENYTDSEGIIDYADLASGTYAVDIIKPGFNDYGLEFYHDNDTETNIAYMTYESTGIVKIVYSDLTLKNHDICFYMSNKRLLECYGVNDTMILTLDNYDLYVKTDNVDYAANSNYMLNVVRQFAPLILIALLTFGVILLVIVGVIYMRGSRR